MNTAAGSQIDYFLQTLTSFAGVTALISVIFFAILCYVVRPMRWWMIGGLLFISTLPVSEEMVGSNALAFPLEDLKRQGRAITMGFLVILFALALRLTRSWRSKLIAPAAWAFLAFEVAYSCRIWFGGQPERGFTSLLLFSAIFMTFGFGLGRWLQETRDVRSLLHGFAIGGTVYVVASVYQFLQNPSASTVNHRFFGISVNPQFAGTDTVLFLLPCVALVLHKQTRPLARVFLAGVAALLAVLLVWTGSRTAGLMGFVGVLTLLRMNIRRTLLIGVLGSVGFYFFWSSLGFQEAQADRFLSLDNTRAGIATALLQDFARSPAYGTMSAGIVVRENSYLSVLSVSGLLGGLPFFLAMGLLVAAMIRLQRVRKALGTDAVFADLVVAAFAAILVGALFEGFLLGLLTIVILSIYMYFAIMAFLFDYAKHAELPAEAMVVTSEYSAELYEAGYYSGI